MARRGQAFRTHHIHLILSDPEKDPGHVVLVNLTSCRDAGDRARPDCLFKGEHPCLDRDSYVAFVHARTGTAAAIDHALSKAKPVTPDFSSELLNRICRAAGSARELAANIRAILKAQGFVT